MSAYAQEQADKTCEPQAAEPYTTGIKPHSYNLSIPREAQWQNAPAPNPDAQPSSTPANATAPHTNENTTAHEAPPHNAATAPNTSAYAAHGQHASNKAAPTAPGAGNPSIQDNHSTSDTPTTEPTGPDPNARHATEPQAAAPHTRTPARTHDYAPPCINTQGEGPNRTPRKTAG